VAPVVRIVRHMPSFTSPLAESLAPELLRRFCDYVRVDTQSARDRTTCPSTPGQLELAGRLAADLREAGLADAAVDDNGYVTASLAATAGNGAAPVIGLIAHVDTSPDAPGAGVEPLVHRGYDGGAIELPQGGTVLDPADMPELEIKRGHDIVTSSGDTLLGADDKAGVAEIMTAVAHLAAHPGLPRPELRVCFTPDEEIGEGATLFDIERFGARCAYTIDGSDLGGLEDETFSADEVIVTVRGVDIHPGQATGKLVSALRIAAEIVDALPSDRLTPDTTAGRDGFIHPYQLTGTAAAAEIRLIIRDFDERLLHEHTQLLRDAAETVVARHPRARLEFDVREQYRNMRQYLDAVPEVVAAADIAIRAEGIEPTRIPIRGGTDGSRLSEMGLPTPNIFTGCHEFHSVREWASLQDMAAASSTIVHLAEVWARGGPPTGDGAGRERSAVGG
jgi:tripeptide aminopeptidase